MAAVIFLLSASLDHYFGYCIVKCVVYENNRPSLAHDCLFGSDIFLSIVRAESWNYVKRYIQNSHNETKGERLQVCIYIFPAPCCQRECERANTKLFQPRLCVFINNGALFIFSFCLYYLALIAPKISPLVHIY